jgi:hypothetical protein
MTAMQELIEKIQVLKMLDAVINPLDIFQNLCERQLEKEKQQIIDAIDDAWDCNDKKGYVPNGEKYFSEKYGHESEEAQVSDVQAVPVVEKKKCWLDQTLNK